MRVTDGSQKMSGTIKRKDLEEEVMLEPKLDEEINSTSMDWTKDRELAEATAKQQPEAGGGGWIKAFQPRTVKI